ncbi:MAG: hypothetical protein GY727_03200, partial [Gammaproteobacteria bacterium]|nr:hypothetical protein [Gammaproteobacteria bacterium]
MSYWKISCIATLTAKAIARIKIAQNNTVPSLRALSIMALSVMFYCITTGYVAASCECNAGGTCYDVTNDTSFDSVPWLNLSPGDTIRIHYRATPYQRNVSLDDSGTFENPITICGVADPDNNRPTISGSGTGPGGNPVIYIGGTSNIQIEGLILTQGRRGIESDAWPGSDNIVISNNEIFTNGDTTPEASNHGGGINIYGDDIHIVNNTVRNNFSGRSGGIFIRGTTNEIRGNLIQNNRGYHDHGGGLYINGSSDTTVAGNIIEGNVTGPFQGGGHGGGILIAESSNISLSYNTVRKNFAYAAGAGMWIDEASTATLDHELVYNNVSNRYGAGIGVDERYTLDPSHAVITNSTIAYNYSTQDRSYGYGSGNGLMCDTGSTAEVRNTIFYGNKRLTGCSDLQSYDLTGCDFSGPPDDFRISTQSASVPVDPGAITMTYSLSGQSWPGIGNTHVDPLFIDSNNGDFHLASSTSGCSPAIDAGDPASLYSNELEDNGDRINMGVYGNTVEASNPCSCRGNGNCYEITDESSFDAVPWLSLGSGDTVLIHHKQTPYRKRFGLHAIGTASQPVRITGVRSPDGDLPHLLGENATTPANMSGFYDYGGIGYPGFRGMVLINGMQWGEIPSNIIIENLKITGANQNNTFYDEEGTQRTYYGGAGGIYVYVVNGLTVRNCEIADNGNGFYTRSTGAEEMTTRNVLVERNYIHSNGNVGGDQRHNIYTESAGITFQYNRIGRERPDARGSSFKDRSSGLVFRYNWIESTARTMDMVEAEDGAPILIYEPDYDKTYVYGNIIINEVDDKDDYVSAVNLIHYGGDNNVDDG